MIDDDNLKLIERMAEAALAEATREIRAERDEFERLLREDDRVGRLLGELTAARATLDELVAEMEFTLRTIQDVRRSNLPDLAERLLDGIEHRRYSAVKVAKERR